MPKLISFKSYLNEKLADPELAEEYQKSLGQLRFALSLTLLRESRSLSQAQLGELAGIKQPVIARYESGTIPNTKNLQRLAIALKGVVTIAQDGGIRIEAAEPHERAA